MPTPLSGEDLDRAVAQLPGWRVTDNGLTASYRVDRTLVPSLYVAVAAAEDAADHHAEITILYGTVSFVLNTHSEGGAVTEKDTDMAARINEVAADHQATPL
ncbi:4a-hydroxytetrahydrobiopterin dehydratase [Streptomyces durbertensis]|uniref:Putative pterin-4-alpha-carbinolamine dehydratase n=1 Tax=Streptomyces durbertensis TaxID=2448886 RepID=A0ABR6EPN5_9ACTN|nr:4a-hydroxytetrahydrobiopterin dehydratase [Streptomyces durbertensis]MBB1247285.1 4a-hydroxytetrahydrobiopterin dehydratase [Streptomyces durbertensis]